MKLIEISSYPKSGNTWARYLVKEFLDVSGATETPLPISAHKAKDDFSEKVNGISLPNYPEEVAFYKSHVVDNAYANPTDILYIYRHPLDVFLSSLNFLNHQAPKMKPGPLKRVFKDGNPKGVEELVKTGEMDYYFDRFTDDLGASFYKGMLKDKARYFDHVLDARSNKKSFSITYESLIDDAEGTTKSVLQDILGISLDGMNLDLDKVDKSTKGSKRKTFFWQAKKGTRFDFLRPDQIASFEEKYRAQLVAIGYLTP